MNTKKNQKILKNYEIRYPNLSTILMIEDYLKKNKDLPIKITNLRENLPKKIMFKTLKLALDYLYISGKIIYGPRGFQWTFQESDSIKNFLKDAYEFKYNSKKRN
jgi:hypothetical protein